METPRQRSPLPGSLLRARHFATTAVAPAPPHHCATGRTPARMHCRSTTPGPQIPTSFPPTLRTAARIAWPTMPAEAATATASRPLRTSTAVLRSLATRSALREWPDGRPARTHAASVSGNHAIAAVQLKTRVNQSLPGACADARGCGRQGASPFWACAGHVHKTAEKLPLPHKCAGAAAL